MSADHGTSPGLDSQSWSVHGLKLVEPASIHNASDELSNLPGLPYIGRCDAEYVLFMLLGQLAVEEER